MRGSGIEIIDMGELEGGDGGEGDLGAVGEGEEVVVGLELFNGAGDGDVGAAVFAGVGAEIGDSDGRRI